MQRAKWTDEEDELDEKIYITLCEDIGQGGKKKKEPDLVALDLRWTPSVSFHRFEGRVKMTQIRPESEFCKENSFPIILQYVFFYPLLERIF